MAKHLLPMIKENTQKAVLLLVDDDSLVTSRLAAALANHYQVVVAASRTEAIDLYVKALQKPDLALVDLGLPPVPHQSVEGFALIEELLNHEPDLNILVLTEHEKDTDARHALTLGAVDIITKSSTPELFEDRLDYHLKLKQLKITDDVLYEDSAIIGESSVMKALREKINQLSDPVYPVLIEGAPGTEIELVAKTLHEQGPRSNENFNSINCAKFSAEFIEAKIFGFDKNMFADQAFDKAGLLHITQGGTLFLNEVDTLPYDVQLKLLNLVETGNYSRVGEGIVRQSKARIVTATNKNLLSEVESGRFRNDLYHRISTLKINIPPMSERENDSLLLMRHFRRLYKDTIKPFTLSAAATSLWMKYDFPGNVRELRNVIIRLGTKYTGTNITDEQLAEELEIKIESKSPEKLKQGFEAGRFNDAWFIKQISSGKFDLKEAVSDLETHCIEIAMSVFDKDLNKVANALKIERTELFSRINKKGSKNVS